MASSPQPHLPRVFDEELLARNGHLMAENRILRELIKGPIRLTEPERISLASAAKRLGRKALEKVSQIVRPESILAWHCRVIAKKFDGSKARVAECSIKSGFRSTTRTTFLPCGRFRRDRVLRVACGIQNRL